MANIIIVVLLSALLILRWKLVIVKIENSDIKKENDKLEKENLIKVNTKIAYSGIENFNKRIITEDILNNSINDKEDNKLFLSQIAQDIWDNNKNITVDELLNNKIDKE